MKLKEERKEENKKLKKKRKGKKKKHRMQRVQNSHLCLSPLIQLPCKDNTPPFKRGAKSFSPDLLQPKIFIPNFQYHTHTLNKLKVK